MKLVVSFLCLLTIVSAQVNREDTCFNHDDSCTLCIQDPNCQWCAKTGTNSDGHHCFSHAINISDVCEKIENPKSFSKLYLQNKKLTEVNDRTENQDIVQLRPQHIKLKLRKGVSVNVTLTYRQVADYPLDLYYLMDLSKSMLEHKKTLASLGKELAGAMLNLTSKFNIGFGSFVDKVMAPFVNTHPNTLRKPCSNLDCATPFSFRNNLPLTKDHSQFKTKVGNAKISSNLDTPEGGLDALMQALVCEKEIGWRKNVRKIIVLSTDAAFHFAGDGKLAGVVTPNDKTCHLNKEGYYDQFHLYDYPSIGQINDVVKEKGVNLIFAVKSDVKELYKRLSERIKDSAYGDLKPKSDNIIQLVTGVYNSITSQVEIEERGPSQNSPVSLRYFSSCGTEENETQRNFCSDVKEGKTFDFTVEVTATRCPKGKKTTSIDVGTLQDVLTIDIELDCDCKCSEDIPASDRSSHECNYKGDKVCDICSCSGGNYGKDCQCSREGSSQSQTSNSTKCRPEGSEAHEPVCSGKGRCECEQCSCWDNNYGGKYCQCNNGLCRRQSDSDLECSGHGKCECGKCRCNPGYEGSFCECQDQQACKAKGDVCSGNGKCNCGVCDCDVTYTGKYCEECPVCGVGKCLEFRDCVQCDIWGSGELHTDDCKKCEYYGKVQRIPTLEGPIQELARLCTFSDESTGCDFNFTYKYILDQKDYKIYSQNSQKCPEPVNVLAVSFGVVLSVVAIGVLTLIIWKIVTTVHDRQEFAKFQKEVSTHMCDMSENPLYKDPTTTTANPAFSG